MMSAWPACRAISVISRSSSQRSETRWPGGNQECEGGVQRVGRADELLGAAGHRLPGGQFGGDRLLAHQLVAVLLVRVRRALGRLRGAPRGPPQPVLLGEPDVFQQAGEGEFAGARPGRRRLLAQAEEGAPDAAPFGVEEGEERGPLVAPRLGVHVNHHVQPPPPVSGPRLVRGSRGHQPSWRATRSGTVRNGVQHARKPSVGGTRTGSGRGGRGRRSRGGVRRIRRGRRCGRAGRRSTSGW